MEFLTNFYDWFGLQSIGAQLLMIGMFLVFQALVTFVFWASGLGARIVSPPLEGFIWIVGKLKRKGAQGNDKR